MANQRGHHGAQTWVRRAGHGGEHDIGYAVDALDNAESRWFFHGSWRGVVHAGGLLCALTENLAMIKRHVRTIDPEIVENRR
jgi:hypothetical protein